MFPTTECYFINYTQTIRNKVIPIWNQKSKIIIIHTEVNWFRVAGQQLP